MSKIEIEVHESHAKLWQETWWRYAIFLGGRGNGRSGTASRFALTSLLGSEYTRGAIMRAVREDIRASCWSEMRDRVEENNIADMFRIVDNDMYIERGRNSLRGFGFRASSGSLKARLKSLAKFNFAWIEEFEEIGAEEFRTFDDSLRTNEGRIRIVMTTNPPSKDHWIIKTFFDLTPHEEVHGFYVPTLKEEWKDKVLFIPGTYEENAVNMDAATIERYERYKITNPAYYWQQIRGLIPETVMGRIYTGWQKVERVPHEARLLGYGLDFGFDPDEAAVVAVYYHNGGYILDQKLYATGLINADLATYLKTLPTAPIVADSAEPKSIEELRRYGINVIPVEKGADSVRFGIKHVQGLRVSYTAQSPDLEYEYENYAWKLDKEGKDLGIEDPKCKNHLMSAWRYFAMELIKSGADPDAQERERMRYEVKNKQTVVNIKSRYSL